MLKKHSKRFLALLLALGMLVTPGMFSAGAQTNDDPNLNTASNVQAAALRGDIQNSGNIALPNPLPPGASVYYVSDSGSGDGSAGNAMSLADLILAPPTSGDYVLFERGSMFELSATLDLEPGVTYSSYGSGNKPVFVGAEPEAVEGNPASWVTLSSYVNANTDWNTAFGTTEPAAPYGSDISILKDAALLSGASTNTVLYNEKEYTAKTGAEADWLAWLSDVTAPATRPSPDFFLHDGNLFVYESATPTYTEIKAIPDASSGITDPLLRVSGNNVILSNIEVRYANGAGLEIDDAANFSAQNCEFAWIDGNAVVIKGDCAGVGVGNVYIHQVTGAGIQLEDTTVGMSSVMLGNVLAEFCNTSINVENVAVNGLNISGSILRFAGYGWGEDPSPRTTGSHLAFDAAAILTNVKITDSIFDQSFATLLDKPPVPPTPPAATDPVYEGNTFLQQKDGTMIGPVSGPVIAADTLTGYDNVMDPDTTTKIIALLGDTIALACLPTETIRPIYTITFSAGTLNPNEEADVVGQRVIDSTNVDVFAADTVREQMPAQVKKRQGVAIQLPVKLNESIGIESTRKTADPWQLNTGIRSHYQFAGWEYQGVVYQQGNEFNVPLTENVTMTAQWTAEEYNVAYIIPSDATWTALPTGEKKIYYTPYQLKNPTGSITRPGQQFVGWTTSATTADYGPFAPGTATTSQSNASLFYKAVGQGFDKDYGVVPSNGIDAATGDVAFHAVWEYAQYQIAFNSNGGQFGPTSLTKIYSTDIVLDTTNHPMPTRGGAAFVAWFTDLQDALDVTAANKGEIPGVNGVPGALRGTYYNYDTKKTLGDEITTNTTLYAAWKTQTYPVNYYDTRDAAGQTITPVLFPSGAFPEQVKVYGTPITLYSTKPEKAGYNFKGWAIDPSSTVGTFQPNAPYSIDPTTDGTEIKFYAIWEVKRVTLKFDANAQGAPTSNKPGNETEDYNTSYMFSSSSVAAFTRRGYVFAGWGETSDGSATYVYDSVAATFTPAAIMLTEDKTLYACWTPASYTVTLDYNGGTDHGIGTALSKDHDKVLLLPKVGDMNEPTLTGYTLNGWSTEADSTDPNAVIYATGLPASVNRDITLYAIWKTGVYTVTYDANGGTGAPAVALNQPYGTPYGLSSAEPKRTGYTFKGWSKDGPDVTNPDIFSGNYTDYISVTFYAVWEKNSHTLTYDANIPGNAANGAAVNFLPGVETFEYDEDVVLDGNQLTLVEGAVNDGYTFQGWANTPESKKIIGAGGPGKMPDKDLTVYAVWEPRTYQIQYLTWGGTPTSIAGWEKTHNIPNNVSTTVPTMFGYEFKGWSASTTTPAVRPSAGATVDYQAGASFRLNQDTYLSAIWVPKKYVIRYNLNAVDAYGTPADGEINHGDSPVALENNSSGTISRPGYTFWGWAASRNATTPIYSSSTSWDYGEYKSIELFAVWQPVQYTITYDGDGATSGVPANGVKEHNKLFTLSSMIPVKAGYTFQGWANKAIDTATVAYQAGKPYMADAALDLIAVWKLNVYTIQFNANGGNQDTAPASIAKTHGADVYLPSGEPTKRPGYTFIGWALDPSATAADYGSGGNYALDGNKTLYAVWQINTFTVQYDLNGGTGSFANQTKVYNVELTLHSDVPTKDGFDFQGWAKPGNTKADYQAGGSFVMNQNTTLRAVWLEKSYPVGYDANGGIGAPKSQTKVHGTTLALRGDKPARPGYVFLGWADNSTAAAPQYPTGGNYTANEAVTLYAVWRVITYTVTYDPNGGTGAPGQQTKDYGATVRLSDVRPTRSGYTFQGWAETKNAGSAQYQPGSDYSTDKALTLYAVWAVKTYAVSFDANGGGSAPGTQTKTHDVTMQLTQAAPLRDGRLFEGWSTSPTATTAEYMPGGYFTRNADTILYAVWRNNDLLPNDYLLQFQRKKAYTIFSDIDKAEPGLTWKSTNEKILTINNDGVIKYKFARIGTTDIEVYRDGFLIDSCTVRVHWVWWQWILVVLLFGWIYL